MVTGLENKHLSILDLGCLRHLIIVLLDLKSSNAGSVKTIFVSATPNEWEISQSDGKIVEQIIRPTGLVDPKVTIRPTLKQVNDLEEEITKRVNNKQRILVTTLTKRMA